VLSLQALRMSHSDGFWAHATSQPVVRRALKMALGVGTALVLINYGDKFFAGTLTLRDGVKMAITYCVPFCVSVFSAASALAASK
jgi:hypothetical protein